jgi:methyltransferase OMS1
MKEKRYEIVVVDASILHSYPESSFDTVVDTFELCSIDDPVAVLKELQGVCKAGGKILLLEHGRSKAFSGLSSYLDKRTRKSLKPRHQPHCCIIRAQTGDTP